MKGLSTKVIEICTKVKIVGVIAHVCMFRIGVSTIIYGTKGESNLPKYGTQNQTLLKTKFTLTPKPPMTPRLKLSLIP